MTTERPLRARTVPGQPAPLTFGQEQLWLTDRTVGVPGALNDGSCVRLRGQLDLAALRQAVADTVTRHAVLRTTFDLVDGSPHQWVHPDAAPDFAVIAVPDEAAGVAAAVAAGEKPFDLRTGPLLRIRLFRIGADDHLLLIAVHHIVCDGYSHELLLAELGAHYAARAAGRAAALPPLPLQYSDVAYWQRERLTGDRLAKLQRFWRRRLAGAPPVLALPTDRPRPQRRQSAGQALTTTVAAPASQALAELARRLSATPSTLLLALFRVLLSEYSGQPETVIGVPMSIRNRTELEPLIGFLLNLVALRGDLAGDPALAQLVRREHAGTLAALGSAELPFHEVVRDLAPPRPVGGTPLVQATFTYEGGEGPAPEFPGLQVSRFDLPVGGTQYDLSLVATRTPDGLELLWGYHDEIFDRGTVQGWADRFAALLRGALADPERRVSDLAPVPASSARWRADGRLELVGRVEVEPAGDPAGPEDPAAASPPAGGPIETMVSAIWHEVGAPALDLSADFFAVGGHSLSAARLALRLQEEFDLPVSIAHLFSARTIADQARLLTELLEAEVAGHGRHEVEAAFTAVSGGSATRPELTRVM